MKRRLAGNIGGYICPLCTIPVWQISGKKWTLRSKSVPEGPENPEKGEQLQADPAIRRANYQSSYIKVKFGNCFPC